MNLVCAALLSVIFLLFLFALLLRRYPVVKQNITSEAVSCAHTRSISTLLLMNTSVFHGHWTTSWDFRTPQPQKQLILLNCQALVQCRFCLGCIPESPKGRMKQKIERKRKVNSNPNRTLSSILGGVGAVGVLFHVHHCMTIPARRRMRSAPDLISGWGGSPSGWPLSSQYWCDTYLGLPERFRLLQQAAPTSSPRPCGLTLSAQQLIFH